MDKFSFNFGSTEPEEEITPPPTQLEGVIFSFVPAPASELTQFEKDYQNYLNEWDNVQKLSAPQQLDLLTRSSDFIKGVRPGQFNIDKFSSKMEHLYNNLDEEIKHKFYKIFKRIVPRRFAGLELGLENRLTSKNPQQLEFGLVILTMFTQTVDSMERAHLLTKYLPIFKVIVDAHLSGNGVLKNPSIIYLFLRKMSFSLKLIPRNAVQEISAGFLEILEKVTAAILPLKNYPTNDAEQKLWWDIRASIGGCFSYYGREKMATSISNSAIAFFDYLTEHKIAIPYHVQKRMLNSLGRVQNSKAATKRCLDYWDWIIVPGIQYKPEELAHLDVTEHAVERIKKDDDLYMEEYGLLIVSHLLTTTLRARVVEKILQGLNSEDVMIKCAMLSILPELFTKADYARDHVEKILKTVLIPSLDHSHVAIRALACKALSSLNSKSRNHLKPILPPLVDKLFGLLLHDKLYVKYYAIKALNRFAVKLSGEHLIESKILEGHIREIALVNSLVPLHDINSLLKSDVFVNHAPMFLRDTLRRACDMLHANQDDIAAVLDYFMFAKDIFTNDRVVASQATLQAIEPIMVQFLEHPIFARDLEADVVGEVMDILGFATFHIPLITKEFWDAFRSIFNMFQRTEADFCPEFLVPMGNYIARAPAHFLQNPNAVNIVLEKLNAMNLREELTVWEFIVEVVSNLGMSEPKVVSGVLDIIVKVMDERPRPTVLLHMFRAIWALMYVDPKQTLQKLDAKQANWWKKWESVRAKAETGFGHVGKKIVTLGMISLISLNLVVDVPKAVVSQTEGFVLIFKQLVPLLAALQDFESVDYIAPISKMSVQSAESEALRAEAKRRAPITEEDDDIFGDEDDDDSEDEVFEFGGDEPLQQFDEVNEQLEVMEDEDPLMQQMQQIMGLDNEDDEDGVEEIEDQNESVLLKVDHLMLLFVAMKNDPSKFETILGALDEEERIAIEEHLKRVKIGPKSLLDQAIEFVGRHYERYETDPNMKRLNADVVDRINKWLVTPQPLPEKK